MPFKQRPLLFLARRWSLLVIVALTGYATMASAADSDIPNILQLGIGERPVKVWAWQPKPSRGVILFSHGGHSAPWKYENVISRWVAEGYSVYAALHVDSINHPDTEKYTDMSSWSTRLEDMQLLAERYGGQSYVAAGHSYGALVALAKAGVKTVKAGYTGGPIADDRVSMVLALSPPPAIPGLVEKQGYSSLAVPALIQTGTEDIDFGNKELGWQVHLDAYNDAKVGGKRFALIFQGVDHYFGGAICRDDLPGPAQNHELDITVNISLLMLQAFHKNSAEAYRALQKKLSDRGSVIFSQK